jgi:hypothetical protein
MKKHYIVILLFFFLVGWSQKPTVFVLGKTTRNQSFTSSFLQLSPFSFSLSLHDKKHYLDYYTLAVYNPTTQLNDQYIRVNNGYFLSNSKAFPYYNFNGIKMDSFNPNGVSDFGSAIASGLLNLLFESP